MAELIEKGGWVVKQSAPRIVQGVQEASDQNGKRIIVVTGFASTDDLDLDDEVIDQTKWRPDSYDPTLVKFLSHHEYREDPIGKMWWLKPDPNKKEATKTKIRAQFGPFPFGIGFGELYLDKLMDSFSVGFKAYDWMDPKPDEERKIRRIFIDHLLLEVSAVNVPANRNARVDEFGKALKESRESSNEIKAIVREYIESGIVQKSEDGVYTVKYGEDVNKIWDETDEMIRHRLRDPSDFSEFRTITIKPTKPRVKGIYGKLKNQDKWAMQSVLFLKADGWTMADAKKWMADHPDLGKDSDIEEFKEIDVDDLSEKIEVIEHRLSLLEMKELEIDTENIPHGTSRIEIDIDDDFSIDVDKELDIETPDVEITIEDEIRYLKGELV